MATLIKTFVILLNLLWLVWAMWRAGKLPRKALWRSLAAIWFVLTTAQFLWLSYARSVTTPVSIPPLTLGITYVWDLLILIPMIIPVILFELTLLSARLWRRLVFQRHQANLSPATGSENPTSPIAEIGEMPHTMSRRQFLNATAIIAPPMLALGGGGFGYLQSKQFRIRQLEVKIPTLPRELDGYTIAHLSDIHTGKFVDAQLLAKIISATNNLRADMILVTGDLIDYSLADLPNALDAVKRLNAPDGVFMCEGNHDLFQSRKEFENSTRAANVGLLINQVENFVLRGHPVQLAGLRWGLNSKAANNAAVYRRIAEFNSPADDVLKELPNSSNESGASWQSWTNDAGAAVHMDALKSQFDPDAIRIVMAHHPHAFDAAAESGAALTLSGHTHGGQLMLSKYIGAGPLMYRYWSGLYYKKGSALVVSNGAGNWLPLRINAPAEIIHVTLRRS